MTYPGVFWSGTVSSFIEAWTKPVSSLTRRSDQSSAKLWCTKGRYDQWINPSTPSRLALTYSDWSWPVYMSAPNTPTKRVWRSPSHWSQPGYYPTAGSPTEARPTVIPWDIGWKAATAEDGGVLIDFYDGSGGVEALNIRVASDFDRFLIDWAQFTSGRSIRTTPGDMIADGLSVRTLTNVGSYNGRGSGRTPKRMGIVTAAEVASGAIGHALAVTGFTQWGPSGYYVSPATRVEHSTKPAKYPNQMTNTDVPFAGSRLVLPMTDSAITNWCTKVGHTGIKAETAKTFVRAMRDFGFIHGAETGYGDPQIETTGIRNPSEATKWKALGIDSGYTALTLLDGLPWNLLEVWE